MEWPKTKRPYCEIEIDSQGLLILIWLNFIIMTSVQNVFISGAQGLLMLMGLKFFIRWPGHKTLLFHLNVLWPGHLYQKFHQHQKTPSTWNNNVLQWDHDDQILSKVGGLGQLFWFCIFFNKVFLVLCHSFYTWGIFV